MTTDNQVTDCEKFFSRISDLYTLPAVIVKFNSLITDPNSTAQNLADAISVDMAMAAKVLRLVNSSFYGFSHRISSLKTAIVIIGFREIRKIILGLGTMKALARPNTQFSYLSFWRHCAAVGVFAECILKQKVPALRDEGFVAGLLHDIGKLLLIQEAGSKVKKVYELTWQGLPISDAEKHVFGFDHAELGAFLGSKWHYPESLVESIRFHHKLPEESGCEKLIAAIQLSDICVRGCLIDVVGNGPIQEIEERAWNSLGIKEEELPGFYSNFSGRLKVIEELLETVKDKNESK